LKEGRKRKKIGKMKRKNERGREGKECRTAPVL
jgi:hypothetical protein